MNTLKEIIALKEQRQAIHNDLSAVLKKYNISEGLLLFTMPTPSILPGGPMTIGFGHMHIRRGEEYTNLLKTIKDIGVTLVRLSSDGCEDCIEEFKKTYAKKQEPKPEPEYKHVD